MKKNDIFLWIGVIIGIIISQFYNLRGIGLIIGILLSVTLIYFSNGKSKKGEITTEIKNRLISFLQFVPLLLFLIYVESNIKTAFYISSVASTIVILFLIYRKKNFDRILHAVNIYLIIGGFSFVLGIEIIGTIYSYFLETGTLFILIFVGVYYSLFNSRGFLNVETKNQKRLKKYSLLLTFISIILFFIGFNFKGNPLYSVTIPFILITLTSKYFEYLVKKK